MSVYVCLWKYIVAIEKKLYHNSLLSELHSLTNASNIDPTDLAVINSEEREREKKKTHLNEKKKRKTSQAQNKLALRAKTPLLLARILLKTT